MLALGDGENDAEMLALAGTAVAMKGSAARVVDAARGVVGGSNDEDGVADAVEKYVLAARGLRPASEIKMPPEELPEPPGSAKAARDSPTQIKTRSIAAAVAAAAERAAEEKEQKKLAQEMEKAKRTNAELLEASKAATARFAQLRGSLQETEAALASAEEEERVKVGSIREKAKQVASSKSAAFAEAKVADKRAAEAEARARSGGWGDDANAGEAAEVSNVDTWVTAAESEQREAVAAAAAVGARAGSRGGRFRRGRGCRRSRTKRGFERGRRRLSSRTRTTTVDRPLLPLCLRSPASAASSPPRCRRFRGSPRPKRGRNAPRRSAPPRKPRCWRRWCPRTSAATATPRSSPPCRRRRSSWRR